MTIDISKIHESIASILSNVKWTPKEKQLFSIIKKFYERYIDRDIEQSIDQDLILIRKEFSSYSWYSKFSQFKQLLDVLTITKTVQKLDDNLSLLSFELNFKSFKVITSYYENYINKCINFFIICSKDNENCYIAYYNKIIGMTINDNILNMQLPQSEKIYEMLKHEIHIGKAELILFLVHLIIYFDKKKQIIHSPLSFNTSVTLLQIKEYKYSSI